MGGYSSKCSICTHKHADVINDLLRRRAYGEVIPYRRIIQTIDDLGGPKITECAISRHGTKHFDVHAEARARAAAQYEEGAELAKKKIVTDLEFLDSIVSRAASLMEGGDIRPDIKDAIQAVNVKHKVVLKEQNPIEALLDLVADVGRMKGDDDD